MYTILLVVMIIVALLLVVVVLVQNPKGGGLSSEFGGSSSQMFGVQKTGDILEQLTWGFFAFLIVGSLLSGFVVDKTGNGKQDNGLNVEKSQARPAAPAQQTPAPAGQAAPAPVAPAPAK